MNCEEFEARGLDARRDSTLSELELAAAREHVSFCARCAALQDSWLAASEELRAYCEEDRAAQAPARVEMRLRREFRTQHRTRRIRQAALVARWTLAAAAVIAAAASWMVWRNARPNDAAKKEMRAARAPEQVAAVNQAVGAGQTPAVEAPRAVSAPPKDSTRRQLHNATVTTTNSGVGAFTFLPGSSAAELGDAAVLRVRMQRGALGALGLPVNEERAGEWVLVDLLVSDDGLPQAVRLPR